MKEGLTLVTGGAKSGKSAFAEAQCPANEQICYVATGVALQPDGEMQLRIARHQARRPANWVTEERYQGVAKFIQTHHYDGYLLDDATMLTTNWFYDRLTAQAHGATLDFDAMLTAMSRDELATLREALLTEWQAIIAAVQATNQGMVIVTNEVGLGIVPATKQTRVLRDLYGEVNQLLAAAAQSVTLVVSGLPLTIK